MSGLWLASYAALWVCVIVLAVAVVALLRQIGVLHTRLAPMGTHFAGEGPELLSLAPGAYDWRLAPLTVLAFTSRTCVVCRELKPSIDALRRSYRDYRFEVLDLDADSTVFEAFGVRSTPYFVTVDRGGIVQGRGVANSLEQVEELLRESVMESANATTGAST